MLHFCSDDEYEEPSKEKRKKEKEGKKGGAAKSDSKADVKAAGQIPATDAADAEDSDKEMPPLE